MEVGGTFAVVTGGGTAGHVLPALAVAEALVARGHDASEVHYVGALRGIETRLLPETPFPHTFLDVVGLQRRVSRRNVAFAPKLARGTSAATALLRRLRPRVVVSVGGYASLPAELAAQRLRVPVVVVSYDRFPGWASRFTARRAAACAVAFADSPLPRARLTGAPIRQAVLDVDRDAGRASARRELGVPHDRFLVAVTGGSQGSMAVNDAVRAYVDAHVDDVSLAVRHAVGERFLASSRPALDGSAGALYQPIGYEPRMPALYAAADVLVGRGGAGTVHEVAVTGVPAILVPWPAAAGDHQTANVRWLADDGAAVHLPEAAIARLPAEIERLRVDADARARLGAGARAKGELHHSGALAALVEDVALA